jgi:hypothetical protein
MRASKTFAIAGTLFVLGASGLTFAPPSPTPCSSDDGANAPCYWDAQKQGNGEGVSFFAEIAEPAYSVQEIAVPLIDELTAAYPNIVVTWAFGEKKDGWWGTTYCYPNSPIVIVLDTQTQNYANATDSLGQTTSFEQNVRTTVRHEFGHALICAAGMGGEAQEYRERIADAIAQVMSSDNGELRTVFYVQSKDFTQTDIWTAEELIG